jgi:hypothetical protein
VYNSHLFLYGITLVLLCWEATDVASNLW